MPKQYRILLVESDEYSIEMLEKFIRAYFPHTEVDPAKPVVSIELLERNGYDIIVCEAYLRHEERIEFVAKLCQEGNTFIIVITGDTDIKQETFSPQLCSCIHDIVYKPIDVKILARSLQCALQRAEARRKQTAPERRSAV